MESPPYSIVDRVQKTPKPNLPQIFVQLGPVIEVVSALSKKTPDLLKLIDRQGPVFDSPAKTKDVLHTLAENLKSELVRLTLETPPKSSKKSPPPPPKKEKAKKKEAGLEDYLTNFFQVIYLTKYFELRYLGAQIVPLDNMHAGRTFHSKYIRHTNIWVDYRHGLSI